MKSITLNQFKNNYKRLVYHNNDGTRYVYSFVLNKRIKDDQNWPAFGYICEAECGLFGNFDLYLVDEKAMCVECGMKFVNKES